MKTINLKVIYQHNVDFFHIRTVHLDIIKVLFVHQLMYQ